MSWVDIYKNNKNNKNNKNTKFINYKKCFYSSSNMSAIAA